MNVTLLHGGLEPLIYGVIIFIGLAIMAFKAAHGWWTSLLIDIGVFWLVFSLHGGTLAGGLAAAIAALLAGLFFPLLWRFR